MTFAIRAACAVIAAAAAACTAPGPGGTSDAAPGAGVRIALANADFEKEPKNYCVEDWGCVAHADPFSFRWFIDETRPGAGKRSLCIEPIKKEPWGMAAHTLVNGPWKAGGRIRLSALVRVENVAHTQPGMGGGIYVTVHGNKRSHTDKLLHGTLDWQRISLEVDVPANASVLEVGVLLQGTGRVCADDVILEIVAPGKSPV
jgi:hypothetical protein